MADEPKIVYINYFDGITRKKVKDLMAVCANVIEQHNPDKLYFLLSSNGGEVDAGIALYQFLKAIPPTIVMHNTGAIDSIATVVFLAGDERYAANHSTFLFHGIAVSFQPGARLTSAQLRENASRAENDEKKIAGIITANTTISEDEMKRLHVQGESKDLPFAKSTGIIHDVRDPKIPRGALFATLNLPDA